MADLDPSTFVADTDGLDASTFTPDPAEKPRGALGEIGTALKRGAVVDLPRMTGQALKYVSSPGNFLHDTGEGFVQSAENRGMRPGLTLQPDQHSSITNALASGAEMLPSILAPVVGAAGAIAAAPFELPALAATGVAAAAGAAPFALEAGQNTLEKGAKAGLPEAQAKEAARLNAGLTFGSQLGLGLVGGQLLGRSSVSLGNLVNKEAAPLIERTLADLTGSAGALKPFLKQLPISAAEASGVGAAQAAGTAAIEQSYGVDTKTPGEAALEAVPGMLGLTAVMSPFGLAGRAIRTSSLQARAEALGKAETDIGLRQQLARQYATELSKADPAAAQIFAQNADIAIRSKQPLQVDAGLFHEGAVTAPEASGAPEALKALPASVPIQAGASVSADPVVQAAQAEAATKADVLAAARAAEENRQQYVQAHEQIVGELRTAGITPTDAMAFGDFRKAMAKAAKKAGLKASDLTPADYQDMWLKHQDDVMDANVQRGRDLLEEPKNASGAKLTDNTNAEIKPASALALALEDALKRKDIDTAYQERLSTLQQLKEDQLTAIQNRAKGESLVAAAEAGTVPAEAKVIATSPTNIVGALREVKVAEQSMPSKLVQEVTRATSGKRTLDEQVEAIRVLRDAKKPTTASYELLDKLYERLSPVKEEIPQETTAAAPLDNGSRPVGPPNEVGEMLPYTRTLEQAKSGAGGMFSEKQWWQDLAWAVRNPETKVGREMLENGKFTDEQLGQALEREQKYVARDALFEQLRQDREERLRASLLSEAQPDTLKDIFSGKDLENIIGETSEFDKATLDKLRAQDNTELFKVLKTSDEFKAEADLLSTFGVQPVLAKLQSLVKEPQLKQLIAALQKLNLDTTISRVDTLASKAAEEQGSIVSGQYSPRNNHIYIAAGGATPDTVLHEIVHAATVSSIYNTVAKLAAIEGGRLKESGLTGVEKRQVEALQELQDLYLDSKSRAKNLGVSYYGVDAPKNAIAEFVAEALTNKEFQDFLRNGEKSLWTRFVEFVKNILGLNVSPDNLDKALTLSKEFFAGPEVKTNAQPSFDKFISAPSAATGQTDGIVSKVSKFVDDAASKLGEVRTEQHLAWTTLNHIKQVFAKVLPEQWSPALKNYIAAKDSVSAMVKDRNHAGSNVYDAMQTLDARSQEALYRAMGESTRLNIDPRKTFEEQTNLKPADRRAYNQIVEAYKLPGVKEVYDKAAEHNRKDYDREHVTLLRNQGFLANYSPDLLSKVDVTKGRTPESEALAKWLLQNPNEDVRAATRATLAFHQERTQGPYFHLGRNGDYYTRFTIKDTPEARAAAEKALGTAGLTDSRAVGPDDLHIFSRFEKVGEQQAVAKQLDLLGAAGHLEPGWQSGLLQKNLSQIDTTAPSFIRNMMNRIDADARLLPDQQAEFKDVLRRMYIEMLPETSASKAFARRKNGGVAGYDADMGRSFVKRALASSFFVAHNAVRPELASADSMFREGINALSTEGAFKDNDRALLASRVYAELRKRQANDLTPINSPALDGASALGYSFYLAGNPAFILSNMVQPLQLTLPYLGAKHGYVNSSKAVFKASKVAWEIIKDTIGEGWTEGGWRGVLDADISIDRSKASTGEKAFLKAAVASGQAEWTQAHELGRIAEGGNPTIGTAAKLGGSLMHYSEAANRMTTGLAAFNLEYRRSGDLQKAIDYGIQTIKDTQFDYSSHNKARMLGKHGFLGPVTPLVTQFMQFSVQTMELLGRLGMQAVKNDSPGARAEALKAMGGIMATTTMLAGTLGLPFAGLVSAAYNNLLGSEEKPVDMVTDYRNWLADTFGTDAAELIAHGGLRATGVDFASHLDMSNIAPMTRFLNDRRKLKDRFDSGAFAMLGPVVGAAAGIAQGASDIAGGDVFKGLEKALPSALKGPVKAADLLVNDFRDAKGNRIPSITADNWDVAAQALNFTPVKKAVQAEAQRGANTIRTLLQQKAADLRENFAVAAEAKDGEEMSAAIAKIMEFNKVNPDFAVRNLSGILRRRAVERAVEEQTNISGSARQLPRLMAAGRFANSGGMP